MKRKRSLQHIVLRCGLLLLLGFTSCQGETSTNPPPQTFAIETFVGRAYNYLNNMADKDGQPYFDVFWTEPAEASLSASSLMNSRRLRSLIHSYD